MVNAGYILARWKDNRYILTRRITSNFEDLSLFFLISATGYNRRFILSVQD